VEMCSDTFSLKHALGIGLKLWCS